jgi:uncharacterized protein (TIGR03437 family)
VVFLGRLLTTFLLIGLTANCQEPVINPKGVVNAASFAGSDQPGWAIAPGGIASVFGQNLAGTTREAGVLPLPYKLESASVTVDGLPAPLFFVSPTQINFQVPRALIDLNQAGKGPRQVPVVVSTSAGPSQPVLVPVVPDAPGIFTQSAQGCGQGAVLNVGADGSRTVNTSAQSASPGSFISVFATGVGPVYFEPPDGEPAQAVEPLARSKSGVGVRLGLDEFASSGLITTYEGLAPALVGVNQIDGRIPETAPEGCGVPLTLTTGFRRSQPVRVSIRRGGGPCQNAPDARFGSLTWKRIVTTGPDTTAQSVQEIFSAAFSRAPENLVRPASLPAADGSLRCTIFDPSPNGPRCGDAGLDGLSAGQLVLRGLQAGPVTIEPQLVFGQTTYAATLPSGSIRPGAVEVEAAGGTDVGAFRSSVNIPAPIQITTPLAPGTTIPYDRPFQVSWTGGSPDTVAQVKLISEDEPGTGSGCHIYVPATEGQVTFGLVDSGLPGNPRRLSVQPRATARVIVTVTSRPPAVFSAPGLTREATHEWSYEFRFTGLKIVAP